MAFDSGSPPIDNPGEVIPTPVISTGKRIEELKLALADVCTQVENAYNESYEQVGVMIGICTIIGLFTVTVIVSFLDFPNYQDWQMMYYSIIRIAVLTSLFYALSFCIKLLKSYLHIFQRNRHRKMVIHSMASLVEANSVYTDRQKIYDKLLDIIINNDKTGLIKDEDDGKIDLAKLKPLLDLFKITTNV